MRSLTLARRIARSALVVGAAGTLMLGTLTACSDKADEAGPTVELSKDAATGEPIKIGLLGSSGGAVSAPQVAQSAEAVVKYLNENGGGINGHKVDVVVCNQQEDPASATKCANEFVEKKVAVVAVPMTAQGAVMLPVLGRAGIPYVTHSVVSAAEMGAPGAFALSGGTLALLSGQAQIAAKNGVKKFTILIGDTGDAAASVGQMAPAFFKPAGIEVKVVTIPSNVADATPQISTGLADKPDAVTILGDSRQCITSLKALKTAAPDVTRYLIPSCLDKTVTDAVGIDTIEGQKAFTSILTTGDDPSVVEFRSILATYAPDVDPNGLAYLGYQVMMALGEVGKNLPAGPITPQQFTTALKTSKDLPLPAAPGVTFSCNGTAFPQAPNVCSMGMLVSDVGPDGKLENSIAVK